MRVTPQGEPPKHLKGEPEASASLASP